LSSRVAPEQAGRRILPIRETVKFPPILAAVAVIVVPTLVAWWWNRQLIALADDAALPERLVANTRRRRFALWVAVGTGVVLSRWHLVWAVPLAILGQTAAGYGLRQALYAETWSLRVYLWFFIRLYVAIFGFWMAVALAPLVATAAGPWDWLAGILAVLALWALQMAYVDVARWIMSATPIEEGELPARFARLVRQAGLDMPRLERIPVPGGLFANAAALPSLRQSAVVFTDSLLERLSPDEVEAIAAHELAHIEQHSRSRLRRQWAATSLLVVGCAMTSPLTRLYGLPSSLQLIWVVAVIFSLALRGRTRQANETAGDLRAVELTGNPEALISALSKLHTIARVPRRWDTEFERRATHPSLARRIQAIRAAAGAAHAHQLETRFTSSDIAHWVAFDAGQLGWADADGSTHRVPYEALVELRLKATPTGAASLVIVDRTRRRWTVALNTMDVPRVQAVLDTIDGQLAKPALSRVDHASVIRLAAGLFALAALLASNWAAALTAAVALLNPSRRFVAAASVAAVMSAFLAWRDQWIRLDDGGVSAATAAVFAVLLGGLAWRCVRESDRARDRVTLLCLTAATVVVWGLGAIHAGVFDVIALNHTARLWPAMAMLPMALGVALWQSPSRSQSVTGAFLLAAGLATAFAGSKTFLDRLAEDPLLAAAPAVELRPIASAPASEVDIPAGVHAFKVSSDARFVALFSSVESGASRVHVGPMGGPFVDFAAEDAEFLADNRLALLSAGGAGATVVEITPDGVTRLREQHVPGIVGPHLVARANGQGWRVLGWRGDEMVAADGDAVGHVIELSWPIPGDTDDLTPVAMTTEGPVLLETHYGGSFGSGAFWQIRMMPFMLSSMDTESALWIATRAGRRDLIRSRLDVRCEPRASDGAACAVFDGATTRYWRVGANVEPLLELPGEFFETASTSGWVSGWWHHEAVAIRLRTREAFRIARSNKRVVQLAAADRRIVALTYGTRQTLRVYEISGS
jgi:Zn-dependent protease with chaperone function